MAYRSGFELLFAAESQIMLTGHSRAMLGSKPTAVLTITTAPDRLSSHPSNQSGSLPAENLTALTLATQRYDWGYQKLNGPPDPAPFSDGLSAGWDLLWLFG